MADGLGGIYWVLFVRTKCREAFPACQPDQGNKSLLDLGDSVPPGFRPVKSKTDSEVQSFPGEAIPAVDLFAAITTE